MCSFHMYIGVFWRGVLFGFCRIQLALEYKRKLLLFGTFCLLLFGSWMIKNAVDMNGLVIGSVLVSWPEFEQESLYRSAFNHPGLCTGFISLSGFGRWMMFIAQQNWINKAGNCCLMYCPNVFWGDTQVTGWVIWTWLIGYDYRVFGSNHNGAYRLLVAGGWFFRVVLGLRVCCSSCFGTRVYRPDLIIGSQHLRVSLPDPGSLTESLGWGLYRGSGFNSAMGFYSSELDQLRDLLLQIYLRWVFFSRCGWCYFESRDNPICSRPRKWPSPLISFCFNTDGGPLLMQWAFINGRVFWNTGPLLFCVIGQKLGLFSCCLKAHFWWILVYKMHSLFCLLGLGCTLLIGVYIIPTMMLNHSRRCMFSGIEAITKACFGESYLVWRGYAPLNM